MSSFDASADTRSGSSELRRSGLVALTTLAACLLCAGLVHLFLNSAVFVVQAVQIEGNSRLTEERVLALAGLSEPRNLLTCDEDEMSRALMRDPWILDAEVDVTWSGFVSIDVVERRMVAAAPLDRQFLAIDPQGIAFAQVGRDEALASELLVAGLDPAEPTDIVESDLRQAFRNIAEWERHYLAEGDVVELHRDAVLGDAWVFADGISVRWNQGYDSRRAELVRATLGHAGDVRHRIRELSFSSDEWVVLVEFDDGRRVRGELAAREEQ